MSEELEVLTTVTARLEAAGIPYMVTGSMAANFYTVPRLTRDIDCVVELADRDVDRVVKLFEQDFYVDRDSMRDAVRRRGMCNLIHTPTVVKVDFVIRKDSAYRQEEFTRRRRTSIGAHEFFIVAPEDLVLSKLEWAKDSRSELQLNDVRNLLRNGPALDMTYLIRWAVELGVNELLADIRQ
ncbi:MAG TPA: hypothetical protein VFG71_14700 [Nitrospiraceae bacterium]|nr:hypothetical protein [Nitrospiraceae bacterium]